MNTITKEGNLYKVWSISPFADYTQDKFYTQYVWTQTYETADLMRAMKVLSFLNGNSNISLEDL